MIDPAMMTNRGPSRIAQPERAPQSLPCRALVTFAHAGQMIEAGELIALPAFLATRLIRAGLVEVFRTCR